MKPRIAVDYLLLGLSVIAVAVGVVRVVEHHVSDPWFALGFAGLIGLGEVAQFRFAQGRTFAPIGFTCGVAYIFLQPPAVGSPSVPQVVCVVAAGMAAGAAPRLLAGMWWDPADAARRFLVVVFGATLMDLFSQRTSWAEGSAYLAAAVMFICGLGMLAVDALLATARLTALSGRPWRVAIRDNARRSVFIGGAMVASAILLAAATSLLSWWGTVTVFAPLLVVDLAYVRYAKAQRTYRSTVRALGRITDIAGYRRRGSSQRAADLAIAIGNDLGLTPPRMQALEFAAYLEGIGELTLENQAPAAGIAATPDELRVAARASADVIGRTDVLNDVATIVRYSRDAYRTSRPGVGNIPLESGVLRLALDYEQCAASEPDRSAGVPPTIALGVGDAYDPALVDSLTRVLAGGFRYSLS